jgi:hypothetical protein
MYLLRYTEGGDLLGFAQARDQDELFWIVDHHTSPSDVEFAPLSDPFMLYFEFPEGGAIVPGHRRHKEIENEDELSDAEWDAWYQANATEPLLAASKPHLTEEMRYTIEEGKTRAGHGRRLSWRKLVPGKAALIGTMQRLYSGYDDGTPRPIDVARAEYAARRAGFLPPEEE